MRTVIAARGNQRGSGRGKPCPARRPAPPLSHAEAVRRRAKADPAPIRRYKVGGGI